jgi:ribonuclease P protein component
VRREGKRFRTTHVEVRWIASPLLRPRVGVIVPKYKRTAVARNRVKRRLREGVRTELLPVLRARAPRDVVLRALPSAYDATADALRHDVGRIAGRFGTIADA